jgi:hypothetical protein
MKHINIALNQSSDIKSTMGHKSWKLLEYMPSDFDGMSDATRMKCAHTYALSMATSSRTRLWGGLEDFTNIDTIEIEMTEAYCPIGCCRTLAIEWYSVFGLNAKAIRVSGLRNQDEITRAFDGWTTDSGRDMNQTSVNYTDTLQKPIRAATSLVPDFAHVRDIGSCILRDIFLESSSILSGRSETDQARQHCF